LSKETTAESTAKGRTAGAVRCLNCFKRISPPSEAEKYKCPDCGYEWRISWPFPDFPRIRGPVWETNRELSERETSKKGWKSYGSE